MQLIDCKKGMPPEAVYIGRQVGHRFDRSDLCNPFKLRSDPPALDGIPTATSRANLLEKYRRHLTGFLARGCALRLAALRELEGKSTLACWCVDRPARLTLGEITTEDGCHGDVIFTVWTALRRLGWKFRTGDRGLDFEGFEAIHAELYTACFKHPLTWNAQR